MRRIRAGGGWHAIAYTLGHAWRIGPLRLWSAMRARNACKTCALGMGGQRGGMVNEQGRFPEFCKKSIQAMASDLQPAIPADADLSFARLERMSSRELEHLGRITAPLVAEAGASGYRRVSWPETLERLSAHLIATNPQRSFFYFSGRSSNEAGFLLQLFARLYGTNQINNCSFYCHQASGVGLSGMLGGSTGTVSLDDLEHSDLVLLIGGNPASNHPRFMRTLMDLKRRGGKVIVINPLRETGLMRFKVPSDPRSLLFGSAIADLLVQPHIGGDIALLSAVARELDRRHAIDHAFLQAHTSDHAAVLSHLRALDDATLAASSGVEAAVISSIADLLCASKATVLCWAMGMTHHLHGVDNVRMIANLALMRGMVGKPGAGLLPLRGHSNIQGLGTVGVTPRLNGAIAQRIESVLGVRLSDAPALDTMGCTHAAADGRIDAAWCLGGNLFGSSPDAAWTSAALGRIAQVVTMNTTLNTGHVHGRGRETWILPVLARDEELQATTQESMFSYVRYSDGGAARHSGPLAETTIISRIAARVCAGKPGPDWEAMSDHRQVRALMAQVVPDLAGLAAAEAGKQEFTIPGRAVHGPRFKTEDGKARMMVVPIPAAPDDAQHFRLMTIRSEGQFNTVVYEEADRYRSVDRRDVVLMAPADMRRLGFTHDQLVTVCSATGAMSNLRIRACDIRAGNLAMYYPEANILVPRAVDAASGTPSFKSVLVTVEAQRSSDRA